MDKIVNKSYKRIMQYLKDNPNISDDMRRYLNHYATQLLKNNVENIENETLKDLLESLKYYTAQLKKCNNTSITKNRIVKIIEILEQSSSSNIDIQTFSEISYKLDRLYYESDLPIRRNSSLSYNLERNKRKG